MRAASLPIGAAGWLAQVSWSAAPTSCASAHSPMRYAAVPPGPYATVPVSSSSDIALPLYAEACALLALAVPGRLGVVSGRAGAGHVVRGGWRVVKALMDLLELAVNGRLAFQMLSVQALDELMGWLLAWKSG
jgi:hypothetical protein